LKTKGRKGGEPDLGENRGKRWRGSKVSGEVEVKCGQWEAT